MARYAIIRTSDGRMENAVEWDGDISKWSPPIGHFTLLTNEGNSGDTWDGSKFIPLIPPTPKERKIAALIDILKGKANILDANEKQRLDDAVE